MHANKLNPEAKICGVYAPLLTRCNSRTALFSSLGVFKTWSHILSSWNLSPSAPNFEETLMVAIKQGGIAKAAISGVIKTIDSIINCSLFLVAIGSP